MEFDESAAEGAGPARQYFLPLSMASMERVMTIEERAPHAVLARISGARKGLLFDGWYDDRLAGVLGGAAGAEGIATRHGALHATPPFAFPPGVQSHESPPLSKLAVLAGSSSITFAVADGQHVALKMFRRIEPGIHPEVEVTRHLSVAGFTHVAPVVATVDYGRRGDGPGTVAMIQELVESQVDGWTHAMDALSRFQDQVASRELPPLDDRKELRQAAGLSHANPNADVMGGYLEIAGAMGRRTAEMHVALATDGHPAFQPDAFAVDDLSLAVRRAVSNAERDLGALESAAASGVLKGSEETAARVRALVAARGTLIGQLESAASLHALGSKIRVHGDYRLGQILLVEGDSVRAEPRRAPLVARGGAARETIAAAGCREHAAILQLCCAGGAPDTGVGASRRPGEPGGVGECLADVVDGGVSARLSVDGGQPSDAPWRSV